MGNNIYVKRKLIERQLSELRIKEMKLKKERVELTEECNHEIIVKTLKTKNASTLVTRMPTRKYCLLCGKSFSPIGLMKNYKAYKTLKEQEEKDLKKIDSSVCIDMNDYPKLAKEWGDSFFTRIENIYKLAKLDGYYLSEQDIGEYIKSELCYLENEQYGEDDDVDPDVHNDHYDGS